METLTRILLLTCLSVLSESNNLTGRVFTFLTKGGTDHVTLRPHDRKSLSQVSLCLRFYTDTVNYEHFCFFSLATSHHNTFLLNHKFFFGFYLANQLLEFIGLKYQFSRWNSVCMTWDEEHMTQIFVNGQASARKLLPLQPGWQIPTNHSIIVGQAQNTFGGGFEKSNAFTGHITDVHMWDHVISTCEVQRFMKEMSFQPGNYLSWHNLSFEAHGKAKVEKKQLFSTDTTC